MARTKGTTVREEESIKPSGLGKTEAFLGLDLKKSGKSSFQNLRELAEGGCTIDQHLWLLQLVPRDMGFVALLAYRGQATLSGASDFLLGTTPYDRLICRDLGH